MAEAIAGAFPNTSRVAETGPFVILHNAASAVSVFVRSADRPAHPGDAAYAVIRGTGPDAVIHVATDDLDEARAAYAEAWLRGVAVSFGLGFHPDTRAGGYEPPLPVPLASEYDAMLAHVATLVPEDPYAVVMDAWRRAGLVPDAAPPAPR